MKDSKTRRQSYDFSNIFTNYIAECLHTKLDKVYTVGDETKTEPQEIIVREDVGTDALF